MADVYDAGVRISGQANNDTPYVDNTSQAIAWPQDTPNFFMLTNKNTQFWQLFTMTTGLPVFGLCCAPGQAAIIHGTTGVGNLTNAQNNTTLRDVTDVTTGSGMTGQAHGTPSVFVAFNAVS